MNAVWQALAREAGVAAEQMAIGATTLGKINYAQQAYYGQAFFALSIGFERATKLAFIVDHFLENGGEFPPYSALKKHGHDLDKLLTIADAIAERRNLTRLPRMSIHEGIVKVLSDFANNITRYYNLDFLTMNPRTTNVDDPIRAWHDLVIDPILEKHYSPSLQKQHQRNAEIVDALLGPYSMVQFHSERGEEITTVYEASFQTGVIEFARPYARMYVLQIARFIGALLSGLEYASHRASFASIPALSEFFAIFNNSNSYFKSRKTWSIYKP